MRPICTFSQEEYKISNMIIFMSDKNYETFSNNLTRYRKLRGLSQEELSRLSTVSRRMIGQYETKPCNPAVRTVYLLSKALDVSIYDLIEEKENTTADMFKDTNPKTLKKIMEITKLPKKDRVTIYNMVDSMIKANKA